MRSSILCLSEYRLRWSVLQNCSAYRVLHLRHHAHLGEEGDPDHYANYTRWTWLVFCMNSDLLPRMGFLDPLIAALADETVFAAGPRVLRAGAGEQHVESLTRLELERGRLRVRQPFVDDSSAGPAQALCCELRPLPFVLGGACLLRRADYLALGGFDPVFEPFYLEDVDLGWRAWRSGRRCVHVPEAVVEHINQATIAAVAPRDLVHAAIAKNHWLFEWKHLSGVELARHLEALEAQLCDMALNEDRESLEILALALEQCEAVLEARREDPRAPSFRDLARSSDPFGDRAR